MPKKKKGANKADKIPEKVIPSQEIDSQELNDSQEANDPQEMNESQEMNEAQDLNGSQEQELNESKELNVTQETNESQELNVTQETSESQEFNIIQEKNESQELNDSQETNASQELDETPQPSPEMAQESAEEQVILKKVKIKKSIGHEARTNRYGYLFVLPFLLVFSLFNLWPTLYTFTLGFTNVRGFEQEINFSSECASCNGSGYRNVFGWAEPLKCNDCNGKGKIVHGAVNFGRLMKDNYFWGALGNTFIIWGLNFIPQLGLALVLAIWLSDIRLNLVGKGLFRALVYLPNLLTAASVALLFRSIFGFNGYINAPANQLLRSMGIQDTVLENGEWVPHAFNFFRSIPFSRGLVAFVQWWMWYGHTLIMLMAGITSIPVSLYESATVDGANSRQTAWYITLPLLRPMMLYILVTSMIGGMQMFDIPFLLTGMRGEPAFSIRTTVVYQYNIAFQGRNDYSYGAAVSMGIFIITTILALLIFFFLQDRSELKAKKGGNK